MRAVRRMRFCNAFSSFDVTLVASFVKECFRLQIKGKFYINRKLFCSFFALFRWGISKYASGPIMARSMGYEV